MEKKRASMILTSVSLLYTHAHTHTHVLTTLLAPQVDPSGALPAKLGSEYERFIAAPGAWNRADPRLQPRTGAGRVLTSGVWML